MSLAHLGKMELFGGGDTLELFGGGDTFSKGLLPGVECNFIIILKTNVREEGQEGQMGVGCCGLF